MSRLTNGADPFALVEHGEPKKFTPSFPKQDLEELKFKLDKVRWGPEGGLLPDDDPTKDAGLQPSPSILKQIAEQWRTMDFDHAQQKINRHEHFLVDIDWCRPLHYVHRRSSRADAIPLLFIHGWPGSFLEFDHIIDMLSEPKDDSHPAFHIVVPSLPGYAWSKGPPSKEKGIGDADGYCRILHTLMTSVLGYKAYAAQGGDWGSVHARCLGAKFAHPDGKTGCRAVHLNFSPIVPKYVWALAALPSWLTDPALPYIPGEQGQNMRKMDEYQKHMAYYLVQQTKPQQLAPALTDSPVGLLAWLSWFWAAKLNISPTFTAEQMLSVCTVYFCTRSIGTSFLPYHNNEFFSAIHGSGAYNVKRARLGYTDFPDELVNVTYGALKGTGNLQYYAKATNGGHFAALEQPQIFAAHIRLAFAHDAKAKARDTGALEKEGVKRARVFGSLWSKDYEA